VVSLLLALSLLVRCANEDEGTPEPGNVKPPTPPAARSSKAFTASTELTPEPNKYVVKLTWQGLKLIPPFSLYRENQANLKQIALLSQEAKDYLDADVAAGESYQYSLGAEEDGVFKKVTTEIVKVPRDLEVHGETSDLRRLSEFSRLFLYKDAVITTQGKDLDLTSLTALISDNALIQTFPPKQKADLGKDGRNGGTIKISAATGAGRLRILAVGEDGGEGIEGQIGSNGGPGAPGQPGEWDVNPIWYQTQPNYAESMKRFMIETHKPFTQQETKLSFQKLLFVPLMDKSARLRPWKLEISLNVIGYSQLLGHLQDLPPAGSSGSNRLPKSVLRGL
jgi:hypothetical protein